MNHHQSPQKPTWVLTSILGGTFVFLLLACICLVAVGAGIMYISNREIYPKAEATVTPQVIRPTHLPSETPQLTRSISDKPDLEIIDTPVPPQLISDETLEKLEDVTIPTNNPIFLAQRLEGKSNIPLTLEASQVPLSEGTRQSFWITNNDNNKNFQVDATLQYVTLHSYFWIEDDVNYNFADLELSAMTFEEKIYPVVRSFFGSEWTPGVDGDPHLYIVYARGLGNQIAGYYSSADEYHPLAKEYSNAHEMFLMNADILDLGEEYTFTVLAHEFQHMIHWNVDFNEESWMNEGFSELASFINGYGVGYHDYAYIDDPDIQLTDWPELNRTPHYGAAFLFLNYFLNRFGQDATRNVVASPSNGLLSINEILSDLEVINPDTGQTFTADDVFADWVIASYLHDENIADGRYSYTSYPDAPQASSTESIKRCPTDYLTRDVSQYGVDYIEITCPGDYTLNFEGSVQSQVIPGDPYSGEYYFWSNRGDESDMTLTRSFDFKDHIGPLTLTYWTWFDLEKDYDYAYVEFSVDQGETWEILITPSGTADDPSGNSYGWGYNGPSGGVEIEGEETSRWIQESVDLSLLSGQEVMLRFEYITDPAVNGNGLALDDVAIPEIGYFSNFEADEGGWQPEGFVRIKNVLPQTYRIGVISFGTDTIIEKFSLSNENNLTIPILIGSGVDKVVITISGTTPFTRQKTAYRFEIK